MTAYVMSEVEGTDPVLLEQSRTLAAETVTLYGGRYIVRGGEADVVEGGPPAKTFVILSFPTMARAREWYGSPEYACALKIRERALVRRLVFVEGIAE